MKKIFINQNNQMRIGWKILFCFVSVNILSLISVILASVIFQNVHITNFSDMISNTMDSNLGYSLANVITGVLCFLFYRFIIKKEKISWQNLGFVNQFKLSSTIKGFALGVIFVSAYISVLIAMNQLNFEFRPLNADILYSLFMGLIIFASVAFTEEITFRGYFQHLLSKKNKYAGVLLSAILFSLIHLINVISYTIVSLIYLAIAGLLLGIIRLSTNNIWFPIGFHLAWNWTEIRLFGLDNSTDYHWFSTSIEKNTIWNGGESGSGLIIILVEIILILIFTYAYYRKENKGVLNNK